MQSFKDGIIPKNGIFKTIYSRTLLYMWLVSIILAMVSTPQSFLFFVGAHIFIISALSTVGYLVCLAADYILKGE